MELFSLKYMLLAFMRKIEKVTVINMSITSETQKMYYHTLDEGNCEHVCVHRDNGRFFLFSSKLGVTFRCS